MPDDDAQDLIDVAASLDGDENAFERLVRRHGVAVQKQMRNFTRDPGLIEELAQDVFVAAYTSLSGFRGTAPFRHWLSRIATLTGYRFWKEKSRNRLRTGFDASLDRAAAPAPAPGEQEKTPEEAAALLFDLLATLPEDDRLAMTLMYLEHLGQDEIAARLGWSRVAVAVRLHRAKAKLRRLGDREPWKGRLQWMTS